ncbi:hypothetical protein IEO70_03830 [Bacillus sp. AGMB 02131]|uniref:YfjL-like N-terminal domain-containing protein n=1 Tax=Peribacillus faecalis TaxID=2772559 RepID=A0A927CWZ0_9BACI|nr:hypothetical protein [Peribacillus faecalis]MBD3107485.1 hypothetical protein [Peribacillus faecalis]
MKKKLIRGSLLAVLITICLFLFISFYGNPTKKSAVSRELLHHLEEKYDEKFILVESSYNWKMGTYGGVYQPEQNKDIQFTAEKYQTDIIADYYPEEVWLYEIEQELIPTAKEIFADYDQVQASTVWGIGDDEVMDGHIPSYKDITNRDALQIVMRKKAYYTAIDKEEVEQRIFALVQFLKEKSNTVGIMVAFDDPDEKASLDDKDGFYNIAGKDLPDISNVSDIRKYLIEL